MSSGVESKVDPNVKVGHHKRRSSNKYTWKHRIETVSDLLSIPLWSQLQLSIYIFHENAVEQFRLNHIFEKTPLLEFFASDFNQIDILHLQTINNNSCVGTFCPVCHVDMASSKVSIVYCKSCGVSLHLICAARQMDASTSERLIPSKYSCMRCGHSSSWTEMVRRIQKVEISIGKNKDFQEDEEEENDEDFHEELECGEGDGCEEDELSYYSISSDEVPVI